MYINSQLYNEAGGLNRLKNFVIPNSEYKYSLTMQDNKYYIIRRTYKIGNDTIQQTLRIKCTEKQYDKIMSYINSTIDYY